jgi:hypothetical protein
VKNLSGLSLLVLFLVGLFVFTSSVPPPRHAHAAGGVIIINPDCGTPSPLPSTNQQVTYVDQNGNLCTNVGSVSVTIGAVKPGTLTQIALDIASVTTGGTPVNALSTTHASAGGFVITANAAGICVNVLGAAGTATSGNTDCVVANQPYFIPPTANAVSVNSTASSVTLAGYGFE